MDLTTLQTVLVAIAPSFTAFCTIIGGLIKISSIMKKQKRISDSRLLDAETKLQKAYNDIAVIKAKCESMENIMKGEK